MATESRFFDPYYCLNVAVMGSYLYCRDQFDMSALQETSVMSFGLSSEQQIFAMAGIFYLIKLPHMTTIDARIGKLFFIFKVVVAAISAIIDTKMLVGYVTVFVLMEVFVKQPIHIGEHCIREFHDPKTFVDTVVFQHDVKRKKKWLIYCYASWAGNSIQLSPIFAELSMKYGGKYLKFGKIDVGKHRGIANKYNISIKPSTKQLPTVLLICDGQETARMPDWVDSRYKKQGVKKVPISVKSVEDAMNLSEMAEAPKASSSKKKSHRK